MKEYMNIHLIAVMAALMLATTVCVTAQDRSSDSMHRLSFENKRPRQVLELLSEITGQSVSASADLHHYHLIDLVTDRISSTEAVYLLVEQLWRKDIQIFEHNAGEFVARERASGEASAAEPYLSDITTRLTQAPDVSAIAAKHALPSMADGAAPFLEVLSITPESPAVLSEGSRITAEIRYGSPSTQAVRVLLRAHPYGHAYPSDLEPGGIGHVERSVWLRRQEAITNLTVVIVEQDTHTTVAELDIPVSYTKNIGFEIVPGLSFHDFQCLPGRRANIFVCEPVTIVASYSNETQESYFFDMIAKDRNGQTIPPSAHSGLGAIRPGTGSAQVRLRFDNTTFIDSIMLQVLTTNRQRRFTVGEIDAEIIYSLPRPDVAENPLFKDLSRVSYHPDLQGIDNVKRALYDRGLKRLGMSFCRSTYPVIVIDQDVPVEAAQEVLRVCRNYLQVPIQDIYWREIAAGSSPGRGISIGVQRRPRYAAYPAARLDRLLMEGLSQDQFIQILKEP